MKIWIPPRVSSTPLPTRVNPRIRWPFLPEIVSTPCEADDHPRSKIPSPEGARHVVLDDQIQTEDRIIVGVFHIAQGRVGRRAVLPIQQSPITLDQSPTRSIRRAPTPVSKASAFTTCG